MFRFIGTMNSVGSARYVGIFAWLESGFCEAKSRIKLCFWYHQCQPSKKNPCFSFFDFISRGKIKKTEWMLVCMTPEQKKNQKIFLLKNSHLSAFLFACFLCVKFVDWNHFIRKSYVWLRRWLLSLIKQKKKSFFRHIFIDLRSNHSNLNLSCKRACWYRLFFLCFFFVL